MQDDAGINEHRRAREYGDRVIGIADGSPIKKQRGQEGTKDDHTHQVPAPLSRRPDEARERTGPSHEEFRGDEHREGDEHERYPIQISHLLRLRFRRNRRRGAA
jgi:hypothetical protein